jgi:hypothetical protein
MNKTELRAALDDFGVTAPADATKSDLEELLAAQDAGTGTAGQGSPVPATPPRIRQLNERGDALRRRVFTVVRSDA